MALNLTLPPGAAFDPLTRLQLTLEALTEPELLVLQATASAMLINRHIAEIRQATPEHRKAAPATPPAPPRPASWTTRMTTWLRRLAPRGQAQQGSLRVPSHEEMQAIFGPLLGARLSLFTPADNAPPASCAPPPFWGTIARVRFCARALSAAAIEVAVGDGTAPEPLADG